MIDRNQAILQQLLKEELLIEDEFLKNYNMTSRQLDYRIKLFNEKLSEASLPTIEKSQGTYYCSKNSAKHLSIKPTIKEVFFAKEDRPFLIIIMILTRHEPISLDHFSIDMQVSKNTVLTDVKGTKDFINRYNLTITFSRKSGYVIIGSEWDKRIALFHALTRIYRIYGDSIIDYLVGNHTKYHEAVTENLLKIEKDLNIKYTDEDYYPLSYLISIILFRIEINRIVDTSRIEDRKEIEVTKEYQSIFHLTKKNLDLPVEEKVFIALLLLSTNVRNKQLFSDKDLPLLANALWEFLTKFEMQTFLVLPDKTELLQKLMNHFKPAYYRIKYNIQIDNALYHKIIKEYKVLHDFVKQSISPLESFFLTKISDEEVSYITLFVGGHLAGNEHNDFEDKILKAVILCPNGISVSKLIEKNLKEIFPEFLFYPTNSLREYEGFLLPHDIIFSTIPIESTKDVYVIHEILTSSEGLNLRRRVINDVFKVNFDGVGSQDIISVVKRHAYISNEERLLQELDSLLIKQATKENDLPNIRNNEGIVDFLTESDVVILQNKLKWEEILVKVSEPLLSRGIISAEYVGQLKNEYQSKPAYIVLRNSLLLPHLDPKEVSQKLGLSLLISKAGVDYNDKKINIVALLTTPNETSHLNLLYDINAIAKDKQLIEKLTKLTNEAETINVINSFILMKEG